IADAALDFGDGKIDFSGVARLLDNAGTVDQSSTLPVVDTGLDTILAATERSAAWKFAIPTLAERVAGISGGEFAIAFARPEIGKTAFWVTLVAAGSRVNPATGEVSPGGFLSQGARVLAICNEEPANRTILRALTCCTGKTKEQLLADPESIRKQWDTIRRNLVVIDAATVSVKELEVLVTEHKPDVVIVDQLDKVQIDGQFNRGDESLTELYRRAREIAKRNNCAVFAICQASADAEGKAYVHYSTLAGSKTGKAGEADLIIGIGVDIDPGRPNDDLTRTLYVSKNKLTGWHGPVTCILNPQVSRYES
ncbi:MAG: AAA family ATPase, partial [Chitinophagaceae bacterium]|nr:AAA family ATPase [Chitinophagaceae bacterium]